MIAEQVSYYKVRDATAGSEKEAGIKIYKAPEIGGTRDEKD